MEDKNDAVQVMEQKEKLFSESVEEVRTGSSPSFLEKNFLGVSILVSAVMISGSVLYSGAGTGGQGANVLPGQQQQQQQKVVSITRDDDPFQGNKNAKVTVIEFSDYQCPFCRVFWKDTYFQLKKDYIDTGKVLFVYRDYPLDFHKMANVTAQAGECADDQGKYWEMHDKIFSEQALLGQNTVNYTVQDLKKWAGELGVNSAEFAKCLDSGKYKAEVDKDLADASAVGITGTPTFVINGKVVVGAQPYAALKQVIDAELNK